MRAGTHEVEIKTKQGEPLTLSLVLPVGGTSQGAVTIGKSFVGIRIASVAKVVSALRLVQDGCEIELFALKVGAQLGMMNVQPIDLHLKPGFFSFVDDLMKITERFHADLVLPKPDQFTRDDEEAFFLLRAFALNQPIELKQFAFTLVKSSENAELFLELTGFQAFRAEHEYFTAVLFGTQIKNGPCAIQMDKAEIENLARTLSKFRRARIGEGVRVVLHPLTPVKFELIGAPAALTARN